MKHLSFLLLVALPMGAQQKQPEDRVVLFCAMHDCGYVSFENTDPVTPTTTYKHSWSFSTNDEYLTITRGLFPNAVSVETHESTVVKLSDEEYANLQKLRQAVVDEEKRLAVKYGAKMPTGCVWNFNGFTTCDQAYSPGDHYEFHQQFLLIDKDHASGISDTPAEILKYLPDGISGGLSPATIEWMEKHSVSDQNIIILVTDGIPKAITDRLKPAFDGDKCPTDGCPQNKGPK